MDREEESASDAAAEAFDAVRGEIALLRRAVERLAAEKADMPDYTVTLGEIRRDQRLAAERVDALATSPVLSLTPAAVGAQVEKVAADLRRCDRPMLDAAQRELEAAMTAITARVASARSRDRQFYWVAGSGASGLVVGMLFLLLLAGPVARTLPESWRMPEKIAAWTIGTSIWEAGQRMMRAADPVAWDALIRDYRVVEENKNTVAPAGTPAPKKRSPVRCRMTHKC